ncbi:hypothetical protein AMECASPLE_007620 [Ameca splendens]|uniref:Uncharacterized protein n=1 Tax=Ameca splendens TaxID=208324 RepID=A0ABV0YB56_9TELE
MLSHAPQPGKRGDKTHPTPTLRPPISHTRPKMAGPPKCKLRASIGTCTPPQTKEPKPPRPPRQSSSKLKGATERQQHAQQRGCTPPNDAEPPTSRPAKQKQ